MPAAKKVTSMLDRPMFKSKAEEKRIKAATNADPNGLVGTVHIWPSVGTGFGVAIKVDGKGIVSQLCTDKASIIGFLNDHL